jgi:hypothetical protein
VSAVGITIQGADVLSARFDGASVRLRAALGPAFADIAAALEKRIAAKLDGEVLQSRSGRLAASIVVSSDGASAEAGMDTSVAPYGPALEFGASIPAQMIAAKNAKALAFLVGGQKVFAKRVSRPAFVLPPHSFLRSALAELEPQVVARLGDAVSEAMAP